MIVSKYLQLVSLTIARLIQKEWSKMYRLHASSLR